MTATISVAKVYLRSIIFILTSWTATVVYGMHVAPVGDNVLLALIAGGVSVVILDKPNIVNKETE